LRQVVIVVERIKVRRRRTRPAINPGLGTWIRRRISGAGEKICAYDTELADTPAAARIARTTNFR
jgi:hypothetical protein